MTQREVIGGLLSLFIVGLIMMIAHHYTGRQNQHSRDSISPELIKQVEAHDLSEKKQRTVTRNQYKQQKRLQLKNFDPNTVSRQKMEEMGMPTFLINSLISYRSNGGIFYEKEDILNLYVFDPEYYPLYEPYIQIDPKHLKQNHKKPKALYSKSEKKPRKKKQAEPININTCDAQQLDAQWGVSPKVATNIIKFRDALGGFYDISQVSEVYTLPDSVYKHNTHWYVDGTIKKININEADFETLNGHPYLRKNKWAKSIINYRKAHGNFERIDDLLKIKKISPSQLRKVAPYLTAN